MCHIFFNLSTNPLVYLPAYQLAYLFGYYSPTTYLATILLIGLPTRRQLAYQSVY